MATTYKIDYKGACVPKEIVDLADGNDTSTNIHSKVDSIPGSGKETTFTMVSYDATYECTTSYVTGDNLGLSDIPTTVNFIFVKIISAVSSGTPDCQISFDGTNVSAELSGVGDFCIIPHSTGVAATAFRVKSSGSTERANIEILLGDL